MFELTVPTKGKLEIWRMIKIYLAAIIIFVMVLSGCTKENPLENSIPAGIEDRTLINLPESSGEQVEAVFSASNYINGYKGGDVIINRQYRAQAGTVKIFARIKFKPGAFTGIKLIKMMIDDVNGTISFDPPSVFSRPANLDLKFEGIDLSGIDQGKVDFVYINPNGTFEHILCKSINVNIAAKTLEVNDAEINHFSRYGWCR
ncbi:MAG TPA: hypothetical protein VLM39_09660 [Ignavibacteriaceae bacterium]|nr:hypothetical protein [Ignavibacteriaceae bacterium]